MYFTPTVSSASTEHTKSCCINLFSPHHLTSNAIKMASCYELLIQQSFKTPSCLVLYHPATVVKRASCPQLNIYFSFSSLPVVI